MKLKITVHGVAYEVDVEVLDAGQQMQQATTPLPSPLHAAAPAQSSAAGPAAMPPPAQAPIPAAAASGGVACPIAGTVLEVKVQVGAAVSQGQELLIIEAMKMETSIAAPTAGKIKSILVAAGDPVRESQTLIEFE